MQPDLNISAHEEKQAAKPAAAPSALRLLSPAQTASISHGSLSRLTRPTLPRVLIGARGTHLYGFHTTFIQSIKPRNAETQPLARSTGCIELKLPAPLGTTTPESRDVMLNLSGVSALIAFDRLVTTHRLNIDALADPQDLVPSAWLLGYFDLDGASVAMIDPSALLPVRLAPSIRAPRAA